MTTTDETAWNRLTAENHRLRAALEAAERDTRYAWECAANMQKWAQRVEEKKRELLAERDALKERAEAQQAAIDAAIWFRDSFSGRIAGSYEASEAFDAALARLDQREGQR